LFTKIRIIVPDSGFRIPDSRFQIPDSRFQIPGSRFQKRFAVRDNSGEVWGLGKIEAPDKSQIPGTNDQ